MSSSISSNNKKTSVVSSTEYNFSLLADPSKCKNIDKTVVIKTIDKKSNSESPDSDLCNIQDIESEVAFNNKSIEKKKSSNYNYNERPDSPR